jgi:SecD/SecF fusion protein
MKTILNSIIAVLVLGIVAMGFASKAGTTNRILIQAVDGSYSLAALSQSATIISNRLKDFSSAKFDVKVLPGKNQIRVTLFDNWDLKTVETLVVQKGAFAFYETYTRKELSELLNNNNHLFSLLNTSDTKDSSAKIGCIPSDSGGKINDYLHSSALDQKCKFAWSHYSEGSEICLYALKADKGKEALIEGTEIESVKTGQDKASKNVEIGIRLKESSVGIWAEATKRNMNRDIAIVMDDSVLAAPMVRSVISGGNCTITGNFTPAEARYIAALGNNGELPLTFKIVK